MKATAYLAKTTTLQRAEDGSIQIFPPGEQKVTVTNAATGEPVDLDLTVEAKTAETLEAARAEMQSRADAGEGDAPYFDFNHNDEEASAWPTRIYWAGDDPLTGGVRAEVEWSAAGRAAIEGRTYRRFSPVFHAEEGEIIGAPVNMGGLVNRAAFQRIQPLFAKESNENPSPKPDPEPTTLMTEEEIAALQEENEALKNQLTEMKAEMNEMKKLEAESAVEAAAKEGRIGTDPALKAKWVASIVADPSAKELLLAMAPNPALAAGKQTTNTPEDDEKSPVAVLAKYEELPAAERPAYFAKHRDDLIRARDLTLRD